MPPPVIIDHGDGVRESRITSRGTTNTEITLNNVPIATIKITASNNLDIQNLGGCRNMPRQITLTGPNDGITIGPNGNKSHFSHHFPSFTLLSHFRSLISSRSLLFSLFSLPYILITFPHFLIL